MEETANGNVVERGSLGQGCSGMSSEWRGAGVPSTWRKRRLHSKSHIGSWSSDSLFFNGRAEYSIIYTRNVTFWIIILIISNY